MNLTDSSNGIGKIGGGVIGGTERLPQLTTSVIAETTITVPAYIELPNLRYAAPSGTLQQGDTININITITDADGNERAFPDYDGFQISLLDWPEDETKEILGVLYMNFVESTKSFIIEGTPAEPAPDLGD